MLDQQEIIIPMEPVAVQAAFDDPRFTFQVKWDGVRCLALVASGDIRLQNRRGRSRTAVYPELAVLQRLAPRLPAAFDGEIVALVDGRPSFPRLLERDLARPGSNWSAPVAYMVFDYLYRDGQSLMPLPFTARQELLRQNLRPEPPIYICENFPGQGQSLFAAVTAQGLEGIVAKRADSPYLPGVKSPLWQKIKARQRAFFPVGGFISAGGKVGSLLLGLAKGDGLRYVGRVGSGIKEGERELLARELPKLATPDCPFNPPPRLPPGGRWLQPWLAAEVEFLEWTEALSLRAPRLIKLSPAGG